MDGGWAIHESQEEWARIGARDDARRAPLQELLPREAMVGEVKGVMREPCTVKESLQHGGHRAPPRRIHDNDVPRPSGILLEVHEVGVQLVYRRIAFVGNG